MNSAKWARPTHDARRALALPPTALWSLRVVALWLALLASHLDLGLSSKVTWLSPSNGPTLGGASIFLLGEVLSLLSLYMMSCV